LKRIGSIFNDWPTRLAAIIFVLVVATFIFNIVSDLPDKYPLFGVLNYVLVPMLFVAGGIIFSLAILKFNKAKDASLMPQSRSKLLFLILSGAVAIMFLIMDGYLLLEFTDSTAFCGRLCHDVMYPEYTAYQSSAHSRVTCSECHVGSGASYLVQSKVSGIPLVFATISGEYHRPIQAPVQNLRPARETCEQCHRPERFAGDVVRTHTTYVNDENNTRQEKTMVLRIGGGEAEIASDIHWHIAAKVWYLPMDEKRQEIGWVGVEEDGGTIKEYINAKFANDVTPERIKEEKRLMDCIDCHNRATHVFQSPNELIDLAMTQGKIDSTLPYIKREGLKALDPLNSNLNQAYTKVEAIKEFYKNSYPQIYIANTKAIDKAITELKNVAKLVTFPEMGVSWRTYLDNNGHQESLGCFRCHGALKGVANNRDNIDYYCTTCHYELGQPK
jgi:hypothetical protein